MSKDESVLRQDTILNCLFKTECWYLKHLELLVLYEDKTFYLLATAGGTSCLSQTEFLFGPHVKVPSYFPILFLKLHFS